MSVSSAATCVKVVLPVQNCRALEQMHSETKATVQLHIARYEQYITPVLLRSLLCNVSMRWL